VLTRSGLGALVAALLLVVGGIVWNYEELLAAAVAIAVALLAYLAVEDRPGARRALTALLWGPGRGVNLRQELSRLRRLPRSEAWLQAGPEVAGRGEAVRTVGGGSFLEGYDLSRIHIFELTRPY